MEKPSKHALQVARILLEAEAIEWTITVEEAVAAVKFLERLGIYDFPTIPRE